MIILNDLTLLPVIEHFGIVKSDSRVNMLKTCKLLGLKGVSNKSKLELVCDLANLFEMDRARFLSAIPKEEYDMFSTLLHEKQEYVAVKPLKSGCYTIQALHLVVTHEVGKEWRLYMPEQIRQKLLSVVEDETARYPEIGEMQRLLDDIETVLDRVSVLLEDSQSKKKVDRKEVDALTQRIFALEDRLKESTEKVKMINPDLDFVQYEDALNMARLLLGLMQLPG